MSDITIYVEFLYNTEVKSAVEQAKELAQRLDVGYVSFNFNGKRFSVSPKADVNKLCSKYKDSKHIVG